MLERLKKLQMARQSSRSLSTEFSPLYLAIECASGYLDLAVTMDQLQTALSETHQAFVDLLHQEEQYPDSDEALLDLVEATLDCLESFTPGQEHVPGLLGQLEDLDQQLKGFDLASVHQRLQLQREERELLQAVQAEISEEVLEAGYLQQIIVRLDGLLHQGESRQPTLEFLQELWSKTQERSDAYNRMPLRGDEWTLEVALADRFMLQGYRHWQEALKGLIECCSRDDLDEPDILEWLETLRQGNRNWILVERLSDLDNGLIGGK